MAHAIHSTGPFEALRAAAHAAGEFLGRLFAAGPRVAALERLSLVSDAALEARGTTRAREVERILGARAAL